MAAVSQPPKPTPNSAGRPGRLSPLDASGRAGAWLPLGRPAVAEPLGGSLGCDRHLNDCELVALQKAEASMEEIRVLSPTAILGYGYPHESLEEGMRRRPDVIAVDGGSTDGGPYYLGMQPGSGGGAGQASAFLEFIGRDTGPLLDAARAARIPLLIGSAGFAGADLHLAGQLTVLLRHAEEKCLHFRLASIHAEVDKAWVKERLRAGKVEPLGPVAELSEEEVDRSTRIVGQMGAEPFLAALESGAEVVVGGRANDPSMFAALPLARGFDPGLAIHMAKILECGAIAAEPGSGSDAMLGTLRRDHFLLEPLAMERRCTRASVAAHSLYEKSDPFHLLVPGGRVELHEVQFEQVDARRVRVSGSRWVPEDRYMIKLEGSKPIGFRSISICGIRDPSVIENLDELLDEARSNLRRQYPTLDEAARRLLFHVYGRNGVMGPLETHTGPPPHELCLLIDVVAPDQGLATTLCGFARSTILHHGFEGRTSTAGNLAAPFSPLDLPVGPVFEFNVYHLVEVDDPLQLFRIEYRDI